MHVISELNLALLDGPANEVRAVALAALAQNLDLLISTAGVPLDDEAAVKAEAQTRSRMVMGPGCRVAIRNGVGLGRANRIRPGPVGIIGTSNTAIQEVSTLVHRLGSGVSQAIGAGPGDGSATVGGSTMLAALEQLDDDPEIEAIVLVGALPARPVADAVLKRARDCFTPLVICLVGSSVRGVDEHMAYVRSLHDAALTATELVGVEDGDLNADSPTFPPAIGYVRGVFSGCGLASEAAIMLQRRLGSVYTNLRLPGVQPLPATGHTVLHLPGEEGSASAPATRRDQIVQAANDPATAVLLLDLLLGPSATANPAAELVAVLHEAQQVRGSQLPIIVNVVGTNDDPQPRDQQVALLEAAGVLVAPSNALAAVWAARCTRDDRH